MQSGTGLDWALLLSFWDFSSEGVIGFLRSLQIFRSLTKETLKFVGDENIITWGGSMVAC